MNEVGCVEDIMVVIVGCIMYIFYIEGVGGGYVFDIIKVVGEYNIFFVFINFIIFFIVNIEVEYMDMFMVCYYLDKSIKEDV